MVLVVSLLLAAAVPSEFKTWSLAYIKDRNLYVSRGDGSSPRLVVKKADTPCWSPDRKQLAFSRKNAVWIVGADGKGLHQVAALKYAAEVESLSWANRILTGERNPLSQGQSIVLSAQGKLYQYVMPDRGTSHLESLGYIWGSSIYGKSALKYPVWSPKKPHMAYVAEGDIWLAEQSSGEDGDDTGLLCARFAATAEYDIPNDHGSRMNIYAENLTWSPDGKMLAFCHQRQNGSGVWDLCLLQAPTGDDWNHEHPSWKTICSEAGEPSFSPDGKWIAVLRPDSDDGWTGVCAVSVDGKKVVKLVKDAWKPCW